MKIKYFAWIKDITNKEYDIIDVNCPNNIEELKLFLTKAYPPLEQHIAKDIIRYAINMEYISTNHNLDLKDEVSIFPPVSGG